MNVFIDLGCYNGDTVEEFRNWSRIAFPDKTDWEIYAFDPNPNFREQWANIEDNRTHFIQKAAWIKDGEQEFAVGTNPISSTLMKKKTGVWDTAEVIQAETFDFSEWLQEFENDYVVVKMDIEGAEFPILRKMIDEDADLLCDYLLVEFHPNKVTNYTTTDKNLLIAEIQSRHVNILEWH